MGASCHNVVEEARPLLIKSVQNISLCSISTETGKYLMVSEWLQTQWISSRQLNKLLISIIGIIARI